MTPLRSGRTGLSLLEVLVALTIFLMAFVVLGRLIVSGGDLAADAQWQNQAAQLCESQMEKVAAGLVPLVPQSGVPMEEAPEWQWSLSAQQTSVPNVWQVKVEVKHPGSARSQISFSLSQMILDPQLRGNVLDGTGSIPPDIDPNAGSDSPSSNTNTPTNNAGSAPTGKPTNNATGGATPKKGS
jgi:general secretion pathway protein I